LTTTVQNMIDFVCFCIQQVFDRLIVASLNWVVVGFRTLVAQPTRQILELIADILFGFPALILQGVLAIAGYYRNQALG
jgi:hypothetical protein